MDFIDINEGLAWKFRHKTTCLEDILCRNDEFLEFLMLRVESTRCAKTANRAFFHSLLLRNSLWFGAFTFHFDTKNLIAGMCHARHTHICAVLAVMLLAI